MLSFAEFFNVLHWGNLWFEWAWYFLVGGLEPL